jgi:hypothetical protein
VLLGLLIGLGFENDVSRSCPLQKICHFIFSI